MFIQTIRRYAPTRQSAATISRIKSPIIPKKKQKTLEEQMEEDLNKRLPKFKDPEPIISPIIAKSNFKTK